MGGKQASLIILLLHFCDVHCVRVQHNAISLVLHALLLRTLPVLCYGRWSDGVNLLPVLFDGDLPPLSIVISGIPRDFASRDTVDVFVCSIIWVTARNQATDVLYEVNQVKFCDRTCAGPIPYCVFCMLLLTPVRYVVPSRTTACC